MGMIGNQLAAGTQFAVTNDSYNGDGSTTAFTLSQSVSATTDIEVIVDNVQQSPHDGSYSVSGTALTFSGAPSAGTNNIYVIYHGSKHHTTAQVIPDAGSVDHSKMHTNATLPITRDMTNNRVGINSTSPSVSLEIGATQQREEIRLTSTGGGAQAVLGTYAGTESYIGSTNNVPLYFRTNGSNRAQIDTSGRYLNSNQPGFSVRQLAQSGIDCTSSSYIAFRHIHTTHFNTGNHFSSSTGMFTAPVAGNYIFGTTIRYDSFSGSYFYVTIKKNNSAFYARDLKVDTGSYLHASVHTIMNMAVNDTANVTLNSSGDSSINIDHDCNFYGYLLG